VLLGDFNARVGSNHHVWNGAIGRHGIGNANSKDFSLLHLCSEFDLVITNTLFQQRNHHKATWQHPRSKHWHLIDHIIVRHRDIKDATLTRAMRGAECWNVRLVRATFWLKIRPVVCKKKPKRRLDVKAIQNPDKLAAFREQIYLKLHSDDHIETSIPCDRQALTAEWEALSNVVMEAASTSLGFRSRKHGLTRSMLMSINC